MVSLGPLLGFWPLGSGQMLWWGLAAAIPLVIHLWHRRHHDETSWGAMQFLLAAVQRRARRFRLERWLLLLVRTLILLLFALALADPLGSLFTPVPIRANGRAHVVIVIDGSYSMAYRSVNKSRFELAQQAALELVEASSQGDGFTLILMAERPRVVIHQPAFDPSEITRELQGLKPLHHRATLGATLAAVEDLLDKAAKQHPRLTEARVHFLSDLGANTWNDLESASVRKQLDRLAQKGTLYLSDVGQAGGANLTVTRFERTDSLVTAGAPTAFTATVQNLGDQAEAARSLDVYVDEQRVASHSVRVAQGETASIQFQHVFATAGEHAVEVRLDNDSLAIDNRRWLSVPMRETIRILCVEGALGAARSVALALNPRETPSGGWVAETVGESALLDRDLQDYDAIFLCDVPRLSASEATALRSYVMAGGGLVVFPGARVQADNYNSTLGAGDADGAAKDADGPPDGLVTASQRVLPARLGDVVREGAHALDPGDFSHPLARSFQSVPGSGLFRIPLTFRYLKLTPHGPSSQVVFRFGTGDPALVEEIVGRGRTFLFATAASTDSVDTSSTPAMPWSALATARDFVSLIQELIPLVLGGREASRNLAVGDALSGTVGEGLPDRALVLTLPDGRTERIPLERVAGESRWSYEATDFSGIYAARREDAASASELQAVNIDASESTPERFDRQRLPDLLHVERVDPDGPSSTVSSSQPRGIFRYLLAIVLALLLIETGLAGRVWR